MFISAGDEGIAINDRPATAIDPIGLHMLAGKVARSLFAVSSRSIVRWLLITALAS